MKTEFDTGNRLNIYSINTNILDLVEHKWSFEPTDIVLMIDKISDDDDTDNIIGGDGKITTSNQLITESLDYLNKHEQLINVSYVVIESIVSELICFRCIIVRINKHTNELTIIISQVYTVRIYRRIDIVSYEFIDYVNGNFNTIMRVIPNSLEHYDKTITSYLNNVLKTINDYLY